MPDPIKPTKLQGKNVEQEKYKAYIRTKTNKNAIRDERDRKNQRDSGLDLGWVKVLNYSNDLDYIKRRKKAAGK